MKTIILIFPLRVLLNLYMPFLTLFLPYWKPDLKFFSLMSFKKYCNIGNNLVLRLFHESGTYFFSYASLKMIHISVKLRMCVVKVIV